MKYPEMMKNPDFLDGWIHGGQLGFALSSLVFFIISLTLPVLQPLCLICILGVIVLISVERLYD